MANLRAKLARQEQAVSATQASILHLEELVKKSKDEAYRINGNLVLAQLQNKLRRQMAAVKLTLFELTL